MTDKTESNKKDVDKDKVDYLHPDGKPAPTPPKTEEERENLEKAKEDAKLVKELKE